MTDTILSCLYSLYVERVSCTAPQSNDQQFSYTERISICKMYPHCLLTQENEQRTQSNNTHYKSQYSSPGNVAQPRLPPIVHNRASTDKNGYPDPHMHVFVFFGCLRSAKPIMIASLTTMMIILPTAICSVRPVTVLILVGRDIQFSPLNSLEIGAAQATMVQILQVLRSRVCWCVSLVAESYIKIH